MSGRPLDVDKLLAYKIPGGGGPYTADDTILYALGVGAGLADIDELAFVYERKLMALPTMPLVMGTGGFWCADPAAGLDWPKILHAEQVLTLYRTVKPQDVIAGETRIIDVADKGEGKAALILARRTVKDGDGRMLAEMDEVWIVRGAGGFGGKRELDFTAPPPMPGRKCDLSIELPTSPQQAMIYRLSGDRNPLHIEPETALLGGLDQPILHGLSTMGLAGRALIHRVCDGDPRRLTGLRVRFTAPVIPGESIRTDIWVEGGSIRFRASAPQRGLVVLDGGSATLDTFVAEV
ncbi:MAG: MaoC/PaaZ C-terminal domain-containing protein [Caulobacterales bacterium]